MQEQVIHALPDLLSATSIEQLRQRCHQLIAKMGLDFFLIGIEAQSPGGSPPRVETNYPSAWMERYSQQQLAIQDPVVSHCRQSPLPLIWHRDRFEGETAQQLFEEASAHGLSVGVATSLCGVRRNHSMMMSVACDARTDARTDQWLQTLTPVVHLLCSYAYEAICRIEEVSQAAVNLTLREHECLRWAAAGKTSWETSRILRCSESTVNFHIRNIINKLDVSNRRQAVARALAWGLIAV
ncbi:autoinducer binding domain-containing protein [Paludibacterium purpuratum]|uniref:LuxR family quorum-sensing transcriptional regulator LasR n=1 Tax=Paludibacterium purpuratum TaxID=1144873 RepID=A0A4R7B7E7_9NEIS|nr:autoinducer binding domain-containing protein [Paludibacterium purpuratum]TDR79752.1 LuxR family quorum-sensing transcriptional regulator LasR [Paludibacterium purpuratum]